MLFNKIKNIFNVLRPIHWIKNLVIFLPLFFDLIVNNRIVNSFDLIQLVKAVFIFSLVASCVYIINDLKDYNFDKNNPLKKNNPISNGNVTKSTAKFFLIIILSISFLFLISLSFKSETIILIVSYLLLNISYTYILKNIKTIELFVVPLGILFRVLVGFVEVNIILSVWIISLSFLGSMLLILGKRKVELNITIPSKLNKHKKLYSLRPVLLKYNHKYLDVLISVITSNILVFYLIYLVNSEFTSRYGLITLMTFIPVIYGVFRYIELIYIKNIEKDPLDILLKDNPIKGSIVVWFLLFIGIFNYHFIFE